MKQPYATLHTIVVMYKNTLDRRRCTPTQNLWPMSTNILEARNCRRRWWSCELKQDYMSLMFNFTWLCPTLYGQNDKKLALVNPHTMTSCFIPTIQTHSQLNHVALAALFFLYLLGVSGVVWAAGSCVNLRHAFLLFAAARLMWWPREPCSGCLTQLSASWLWAELGCENVYQILLLSHTLCVHAAACTDHSLFAVPTVNSLEIYGCFRMFSDGGGSILNM